MSIISSYEVDNSAAIAKRFVSLALEYIKNPSAAQESSAQVPPENIYRMLEMFRYESSEDEIRRGSSPWHTPITAALEQAMRKVFRGVQRGEAITQLQDSLRCLAIGQAMPDTSLKLASEFFAALDEAQRTAHSQHEVG